MNPAERQRLARRESSSPRSGAAVVAALVVGALCLYLMLEAALKAIGEEPWIRSPEQWWAWLAGLPGDADPAALAAGSLLVLVLGLVLLAQAVLPGGRDRVVVQGERAVVVVDHAVLASALARRARLAASVGAEQVHTHVTSRRVLVQVRPTSGIPVDPAAVHAAVEDELAANRIEPVPRVDVQVAETGVVGQ